MTRILTLQEAVTLEELASEEEYTEILEDMRDECSKVPAAPWRPVSTCAACACTRHAVSSQQVLVRPS